MKHRLAENGEMVSYTDEEYGVRKDDGLGIIKPVNSSGGLLFLSLLMSALFGLMLYGIVQMAVTDQWGILGEIWWMYLLGPLSAVRWLVRILQGTKGREIARCPQPATAG